MRDLVRETGLSIATVSRALEGLPNVSSEARARVEEAAARLGYVRDPRLASTFAYVRQKQKPAFRETIGFLYDEPSGFMTDFASGAAERSKARGYGLEKFRLGKEPKAQRRLSRTLHARGIRGLIVAPITQWARPELGLAWEKFAAVELGHTVWKPHMHRVERDTFTDLSQAFERLKDKGYRRIGLALPEGDEVRRRYSPLATYLLFQKLHPQLPALRPLHPGWDWSANGFLAWYRNQKPDVILHNGPEVRRWLRLPRGKVSTLQIGFCEPTESGIEPPYQEMGAAAADVVIRQLEMAEFGLPSRPRVIVLEGVWKEGRTLLSGKMGLSKTRLRPKRNPRWSLGSFFE